MSGVAGVLSRAPPEHHDAPRLAAPSAACLRVAKDSLTIDLPNDHNGVEVTISASGNWAVEKGSPVQVKTNDKKQMVLTVPTGTKTVKLVRPS